MRVQIDEARCHDQTAGVKHPCSFMAGNATNVGDVPVFDTDVTGEAGSPEAVDDGPSLDNRVKLRHGLVTSVSPLLVWCEE